MAEDQPIVQATATIKIVPDRSEYDRFKREVLDDINELTEKFAGVFRANLEGHLAPLKELLDRIEKASGSSTGNTHTDAQQQQRPEPSPDQTLTKLTMIENTTERIAKSVEELVESMQNRV